MRRNKIIGVLESAQKLDKRPAFIDSPKRFRGAKAAGLAFQRQVARFLAAHYADRFEDEPWLEFMDGGCKSWCSPDFLIMGQGGEPTILGECKLTFKRNARAKLLNLYKPVVCMAYGLDPDSIKTVQVVKNLKPECSDEVVRELKELYDNDNKHLVYYWR